MKPTSAVKLLNKIARKNMPGVAQVLMAAPCTCGRSQPVHVQPD